MAQYSTSIAIGGILPTASFANLLAAAAQDGAGLDWSEPGLSENDTDRLLSAIEPDSPLRLFSSYATSGRFDALEGFCRTAGLFYRREHDPDHGEDGMVVWWTPAMSEPGESPANADGEPLVTVKAVRQALSQSPPLQELTRLLDQREAPEIGAFSLEG